MLASEIAHNGNANGSSQLLKPQFHNHIIVLPPPCAVSCNTENREDG